RIIRRRSRTHRLGTRWHLFRRRTENLRARLSAESRNEGGRKTERTRTPFCSFLFVFEGLQAGGLPRCFGESIRRGVRHQRRTMAGQEIDGDERSAQGSYAGAPRSDFLEVRRRNNHRMHPLED